jgi:hypothetical protein
MSEELATQRHCLDRIQQAWPGFLERREEQLAQQTRHGVASEKVAENILEDLFTLVLDWEVADLNNQVGYADLLLTRLGIKYLLVEVKHPGALIWNRGAVAAALDQACRYAGEQKVRCVCVSDGGMFYAADLVHGGLQDRVFVSLDAPTPPDALWWVSVHGVYRPHHDPRAEQPQLLPDASVESLSAAPGSPEALLHPKYQRPAHCFAYVGNPADPHTWKLPYLLVDGSPDLQRLPKAIQAVISNYRGTKVSSIPEQHIPDVLTRLAGAAITAGKMPFQVGETAPAYQYLAEVLDQLGCLEALKSPTRT